MLVWFPIDRTPHWTDGLARAYEPGVAKNTDSSGLAAVLHTALDPVIVMGRDGNVSCWSDLAEKTFGWSDAEAVGRRLSELIIPPEYRAAHEKGLRHFLATGEGPVLDRHVEITAVDRAGREFPVELSITFTEDFGEPLFIGFIRDITDRHETAARQDRLLRELSHRVKNMLALVAAIAQQTARSAPDIDTFQEAFLGRLQSLARGHDLLVRGEWREASLASLAEAVLGPDAAQGRAHFGGPELLLDQRRLLGMTMILHELYTNAVKYGAFSRPGGSVSLRWTILAEERLVELEWKEAGLDGIEAPERTGFGRKMISLAVEKDLRGRIGDEWRPEGLTTRISFPIAGDGGE